MRGRQLQVLSTIYLEDVTRGPLTIIFFWHAVQLQSSVNRLVLLECSRVCILMDHVLEKPKLPARPSRWSVDTALIT